MLSFESAFLLFLIVLLIALLYKEVVHPAAAFAGMVSLLLLTKFITPKEALSGFSNPQIASIALLLIVGHAVKKSGLVDVLFDRLFSSSSNLREFLLKLTGCVSASSAFVNNTPIVAMLIPHVYGWAKKRGISPSKVLVPLSYAAILGGTLTLVGTSTNLVVNGFLVDSGFKPLGIFSFTPFAFLGVFLGVLYIALVAPKLLPDRKDSISQLLKNRRKYLVETLVLDSSPIIGKTVEEAGLRGLKSLFLVEILRNGRKISPVSPKEKIFPGDTLIFAGNVDAVSDIETLGLGLSLPKVCSLKAPVKNVVEALIPTNSSLINKTVKESNFRSRFDAAIVAIHRSGEKLSGKIGSIRLKAGDLLLLLTGNDFEKRASDTSDIYVISHLKRLENFPLWKSLVPVVGFAVVLLLSALKLIPLFTGLLALLVLLIGVGFLSYSEVKNSFDLTLVFVAALALPIGKAMVKTGLAQLLAKSVISFLSPFGFIGVLAGAYLVANILTEFITNVAAASIAFPVVLEMAKLGGYPIHLLALSLAFGASASFITPIGYQTNIMVYSLGGYKFSDFLKVGLPLSLLFFGSVMFSFALFH